MNPKNFHHYIADGDKPRLIECGGWICRKINPQQYPSLLKIDLDRCKRIETAINECLEQRRDALLEGFSKRLFCPHCQESGAPKECRASGNKYLRCQKALPEVCESKRRADTYPNLLFLRYVIFKLNNVWHDDIPQRNYIISLIGKIQDKATAFLLFIYVAYKTKDIPDMQLQKQFRLEKLQPEYNSQRFGTYTSFVGLTIPYDDLAVLLNFQHVSQRELLHTISQFAPRNASNQSEYSRIKTLFTSLLQKEEKQA